MKIKKNNILFNPNDEKLRELASFEERTTKYNSANYITQIRNRSAKFTKNNLDNKFSTQDIENINNAKQYLEQEELIYVEGNLCQIGKSIKVGLYIPQKYARIALMWRKTLFPATEGEPDAITIDLPDWESRGVLIDVDKKISYLFGTDYMGEVKKSGLRMAMYLVKQQGELGLHAGSKVVTAKQPDGSLKEVGMIMFGLSGTGKTSLACHHFDLKDEGEGQIILQDDVVFMDKKGFCRGSENNFYIKTEGLNPKSQELLYNASISENAFLENVFVDKQGEIDFDNTEITANGRAVILRSEMDYTAETVDLEKAHKIIFITRNELCPPIAKLTPEQGVLAFMLGESIETSAGDPTHAGEAKREVGTNPFIIGHPGEEGNIFLDILRKNKDIECFLVNTGEVGTEDITIDLTTSLLRKLARGQIKWIKDKDTGYEIPEDLQDKHPSKYYSEEEYLQRKKALLEARKKWLSNFPKLDPIIVATLIKKLDFFN